MAQEEIKRAVCESCHSRCRVEVHVENGHLTRIDEDRTYPHVDAIFPPTRACLRLNTSKERFYHPDRLNFPVKRVGEKGGGKWQTISWDQAFDEIADKLKAIKAKYGAEAIGLTAGTGRTHEQFTARFFHLLGSPNYVGQSRICFGPVVQTGAAMLGWPSAHRTSLVLEKKREGGLTTNCVLAIGIDPSQSTLRLWKSMRDAKQYGVKIIVVDPRRTATAELADLWLQLRPGTDTALLMSMINVIIQEKLYDKEFVEKWCYGFDKLAERAREYPPERVADITWISADKIREAARLYASHRPGIVVNGMGLEHLADNVEGIQARFILSAIMGNIDAEGGEYLTGPARCITEPEMECREMLSPEQKKKQLGSDRFRLMGWLGYDLIQPYVIKGWGKSFGFGRNSAQAHAPTLFNAVITGKPYPVRAVITLASNPMVTQANTKLVYKALKSLDLYVVSDYFMTPSAELADYVVPSAMWLERPCLSTHGNTVNVITGGEQALPTSIPGEYDHKTDYDFYRGLGIRLGQEKDWPWETLEESLDYQLKPLGMTHKEFMAKGGYEFPPKQYKKYEKMGFATPTGKAELYSTIFEKLGYDPLPRYEESFENPVSTPELAKEYPLMLITGGRFLPMYHSEHRQIESLRRRHPHPLVQINPQTASKLGISDGDWVWIESPRGRVRMETRLFDGIDPRVVHAEHGWWLPELPGEEPWLHGVWESNIEVLMENNPNICNKLAGGWPLKTALCKVYKVKQY